MLYDLSLDLLLQVQAKRTCVGCCRGELCPVGCDPCSGFDQLYLRIGRAFLALIYKEEVAGAKVEATPLGAGQLLCQSAFPFHCFDQLASGLLCQRQQRLILSDNGPSYVAGELTA
ncbi:hypothetical protein SPHV1_470049 [Novosphingobium sp. KN65.2]|nr:hypothetical protein SPHV1_470049 [Novosphingobium sp. KN65.2]